MKCGDTMFLNERLISVLIYFSLLMFFIAIINKSGKKNIKRILYAYLFFLGLMAFFYVPYKTADLYRLLEWTKNYSFYSIAEITDVIFASNSPAYTTYSYLIGKTGIFSLLPCITALIFYYNVFKILIKENQMNNSSSANIALALLFLMSLGQFIEVISGIRSMLSFSIISLCIYTELVLKRPILKNIVWYLIASLFHPAAMVLTIIRFILNSFQKQKKKLHKVIDVIVVVICLIIINIINPLYFSDIVDKASSYITGDVYSYVWEYMINIGHLLLIVFILRYYKKNISSDRLQNLYNFLKVFVYFLILFCFEYSIFHRFLVVASILTLPILLETLEYNYINSTNLKSKKYSSVIFIVSLLILFLSCLRGNLSGLKFFEL